MNLFQLPRRVIVIATVSVLASGAHAATICVDDDAPGDPAPGDPLVSDPLEDGSLAHPFDAIQEAIDASIDGDVILVANGTYTGRGNRALSFDGRAIELRGAGDAVVVDLEQTPAGVRFEMADGGVARLERLRFTNGLSDGADAALHIVAAGAIDVHDCAFDAHRSTGRRGAAVVIDGAATVTLTSCRFDGNVIENDRVGSVSGGAAVWSDGAELTLTSCVFTANRTETTEKARGGAVRSVGAMVVVNGCRFDANEAVGSTAVGGALSLSGSVMACHFEGNRARAGVDHASYGGAAQSSWTTFERCVFIENRANHGGALGPVFSLGSTPGTVRSCLFLRNCAEVPAFDEDTPGRGGAIHMSWDDDVIVNSTFIGNVAEPNRFATGEGGAIYRSAATLTANSIIRGNVPNQCNVVTGVSHSNVEGAPPGNGVIDIEPAFVDAATDDFRLAAGSAGIDAGSSLVDVGSLDLAGTIRALDDPATPNTGTGPAPHPDLGAYEYPPALPGCPADLDASRAVDFNDLLIVLDQWGACSGCPADIDLDRVVDVADLLYVLATWGPCPGA